MDLRTAAAELYRALPAEFVATRTALVKDARAGGDRDLARAIGALPKPTVAAWAVNHLVRTRRDEVEQLLEVGAQLREAQAALTGQDLRELNKQQHRLLGVVRRQAEAAARQVGQKLSEPVAQRVQATLHAGMADPWAANALRSGALVRELESTGLGPVDLEGAVAVPDAASAEPAAPPADAGAGRPERPAERAGRPERPAERARSPRASSGSGTRGRAGREAQERAEREARARAEREEREAREREARARAEREEREARERAARAEAARLRAEAERKVEEAEVAAREARAALDEAEADLDEVADERADLATRIAALTKELRTLRDQDREADVREREARSTRSAAARSAAAAERAADRARTALDHLDG